MAVYDPPQSMWKRNVAGVLDFVLAAVVFGFLLSKIFGNSGPPPGLFVEGAVTPIVSLSGWSALLWLVLVIAYFIVLGRTGGTIFQRLFGMKRAFKNGATSATRITASTS
jgi:hypothetical protein